MTTKIKSPTIEIYGQTFLRIPVKTHILSGADDMLDIVVKYGVPQMQSGDYLAISESPLAITQGRAIPVSEIKISFLARLLSHFVAKVPYGIGLGAPSSMQCAIEETGVFRILLAAAAGAIGKLFGRKGDFYIVAGMQAALVDAASTSPVQPYTETVIKGPADPAGAATRIANATGFPTAIMDINDIGGSWAIGLSAGLSKAFMEKVMQDNPQGQGDELTPLCIVRRL